jgi:predicted dehydrogenase
MIHEVHNLRMLCGEISAVQAIASHAVRGHAVEDTVAISLRFASGALGSFMLSDAAAGPRSWEQTSLENPAYASDAQQDCYVVSGTQGSLAVPTMRLHTYPSAEASSWWLPFEHSQVELQREDPIRLQMEHLGAVVRGEARPLVSALDGLRNLQVTEAIAEAARSGRLVKLALELAPA